MADGVAAGGMVGVGEAVAITAFALVEGTSPMSAVLAERPRGPERNRSTIRAKATAARIKSALAKLRLERLPLDLELGMFSNKKRCFTYANLIPSGRS